MCSFVTMPESLDRMFHKSLFIGVLLYLCSVS